MNTQDKAAYTVKEVESHKLKEIHVNSGDKTKKVRNLRQYMVKFPKGHSMVLDEVAMSEQGLCLKAPRYNEDADEIIPGSYPEHYIGLVSGEFVISNVEPPVFD